MIWWRVLPLVGHRHVLAVLAQGAQLGKDQGWQGERFGLPGEIDQFPAKGVGADADGHPALGDAQFGFADIDRRVGFGGEEAQKGSGAAELDVRALMMRQLSS